MRNRTDTTPDAGQQQTLNDTWCQSPSDCSGAGTPVGLPTLPIRRQATDTVIFELTVNDAQPNQVCPQLASSRQHAYKA